MSQPCAHVGSYTGSEGRVVIVHVYRVTHFYAVETESENMEAAAREAIAAIKAEIVEPMASPSEFLVLPPPKAATYEMIGPQSVLRKLLTASTDRKRDAVRQVFGDDFMTVVGPIENWIAAVMRRAIQERKLEALDAALSGIAKRPQTPP